MAAVPQIKRLGFQTLRFHLIVILLFFTSIKLSADVHFVSKTGTKIPPFTSWETAADSIQLALEYCNWGDTVYIGKGNFRDSFKDTCHDNTNWHKYGGKKQ